MRTGMYAGLALAAAALAGVQAIRPEDEEFQEDVRKATDGPTQREQPKAIAKRKKKPWTVPHQGKRERERRLRQMRKQQEKKS